MLARRALAQVGFDSVQVARELQATQTQTFQRLSPNLKVKRPSRFETGRQVGADVLVATDPDADRAGVEVAKRWYYNNLFKNQISCYHG